VRKTLGFDPADDVRPPAAWRPDRVAAAVGAAADALERCKAGERGPYLVTAYIAPDGAAGRVITAGISSPSRGAQGRAQCILDVVRELKMPSPGSYVAKVSFAP
jgi:hypothetical protein